MLLYRSSICVLLMLLSVVLTSCGRKSHLDPVGGGSSRCTIGSPVAAASVPPTDIPPTDMPVAASFQLADLQRQLSQELAALGIDPAKAVSIAPAGSENAVFDLSARLVDPDGPGGSPATGVELRWTQRLVGDYDQNGEVNAGDLVPLAQTFQAPGFAFPGGLSVLCVENRACPAGTPRQLSSRLVMLTNRPNLSGPLK